MKTRVIHIGNSRGIRIPKTLLEQRLLTDVVELEVQNSHLVVRPVVKPRSGWDKAFRRMAHHRDGALLDQKSLPPTDWDKTEWQW